MKGVFRELFAVTGGQTALAKALGTRQSTIQNWKQRGRVPVERVLHLEALTGISRYELRPDIYGPDPKKRPGGA